MSDENLKSQINDLIRDEIQEMINEWERDRLINYSWFYIKFFSFYSVINILMKDFIRIYYKINNYE